MRILIDLQGAQCENRHRGIGRYGLAFAQAIIRNKGEHEVLIGLNGLFPDSIESIRAIFERLLPQENIHVWHTSSSVRHLDSANTWRRRTAELAREAFLAGLQPDVVHIMSLFEGLVDDAVTSIGLFSRSAPTTVTLYDLIPLIHKEVYLSDPRVESWYQNKLDQARRADLLLAISESSRHEAIEYLGFPPERVINAGLGADPQFRPVQLTSAAKHRILTRNGLTRPFVMYTGGFDYRKNMEGLIRAYSLIPAPLRRQYQLALVCSFQAAESHRLETLTRELGLEADDVILTGFLSENDLIAFYNLCEVFVFPSFHEGFGLPALEAMSCGAPVIASNTTSLPEVVGWEDALFDPHDDKAIAEKLTHVLSDKAYRRDLIQHGLEQSGKFSWDKSARRALDGFEQLHASRQNPRREFSFPKRRPKLAYISPLPPTRSGVADYSAELLPELARHYDIDVVVAQQDISDPWIKQNCAVFDTDSFVARAHLYDRILYHFGNSEFHRHMFELLAMASGVVVMHDFFLSGLVAHVDIHRFDPGRWARELYHAHGYGALWERFHCDDTADVVWKYPCNRTVVENAKGVIVHSANSCRLAGKWLGETFARSWSVIPHLRVPAPVVDRIAARRALNIDEKAFVVCSFGILGPSKQNHRTLNAWLESDLGKDENCHLLFVGENQEGNYGDSLEETILNSASERVRITGWTEMEQFRCYLAAADVAVQLRTHTRGETSGTVLDCMNYGVALIVNAHGSMGDLPDDAVYMLPDEFSDEDLRSALEDLWRNEEKRCALGRRGRETILTRHSPRACADRYAEAVESFYEQAQTGKDSLVKAVAGVDGAPGGEEDWLTLAKCIAHNHPVPAERQLLLDVSELVQRDAGSGIQRVVRNIAAELFANPPVGYRVEPVYAVAKGHGYRYARRFTLRFINCPDQVLQDDPVAAFNGDIFLGLDLQPKLVPKQADFYRHLRGIGARVYFLVHDLLPVLKPHAFLEGAPEIFTRWLRTVADSDGAVCVSRTVADELFEWLSVYGPKRLRPFKLGWSHNGSDFTGSVRTNELPPDANRVISSLSEGPTFLMVGTLEPRKGYDQTLSAFELLWKRGTNVNLVLVAKNGWMMESTLEKLQEHPERNRRLFWLQSISDEYLDRIYEASSCLIAASEGEGFGLPLVEAARHKLPVIARDIPVFREVAGEHAFYFTGFEPDSLVEAILDWLSLFRSGMAPQSSPIQRLTWKQSTKNLLDVILGGKWYREWMPDDVHRFWGSDSRLSSRVGMRTGRDIVSTGKEGYLIFGPYVALPGGDYHVVLKGAIGANGAGEASVDVAVNKGTQVIAQSTIGRSANGDDCVLRLPISLKAPCDDLEVRVWVQGRSEVTISRLEILPLQVLETENFEPAKQPRSGPPDKIPGLSGRQQNKRAEIKKRKKKH
jgi:glycosyltransferase involved in cell wall biosynthesis